MLKYLEGLEELENSKNTSKEQENTTMNLEEENYPY